MVDRHYRSTANAPGANADLQLRRPTHGPARSSRGSVIMDLQQDQSFNQIVTGFVIAISLVLGLIIVSVFI
jgi:hypothetical protein